MPGSNIYKAHNQTGKQVVGPIPWGHSGPLSRVVVVVIVDIACRLRYSYSWRATSDTW